MSIWFAISLGVGVFGALMAVIRRGRATVTTLHIDH